MILRLTLLALLPIVTGLAAFGAAYFLFYSRGYEPPPQVEVPLHYPTSPGLVPRAATDLTTPQVQSGLLLVDALHSNGFVIDELLSLQTRVSDRGYDMRLLGGFEPLDESSRLQLLEAGLRGADSFAVILPEDGFGPREAALVERFVQKGGKLLLVSDPGRPHQINSLAESFGLKFQPDYLYNQVEHDLNFSNIFIRDFQPDALTAGLDSITLYGAGSIQSTGSGLAFTDLNTESSLLESTDRHSPMAWGDRRNVLSIADFTFMAPPQDTLLDNGKLLSNIADYLTTSERSYELTDFPHLYSDAVDILLADPSFITIGLNLKNGLAAYGLSAKISGVEDISRDTVFLGLYDDVAEVSQYLQAAGVRVDDTLGTPFAPELGLEGTAVTVLDQNQDRQVLVVLADTPGTLTSAVSRLLGGAFRSDLVSDSIGVLKEPAGAQRPLDTNNPRQPERPRALGE